MKTLKAIWQAILNALKSTPKVDEVKEPDQVDSPVELTKPAPSKAQSDTYLKGTLPYMDYLLSRVGNKEIPGSKNNPVIVQFFIDVVGKAYPDETAHCMAAVQASLKNTGYKWLATLWAADADNKWKSWLTKKDISKVSVGDVATKLSTVANSKRHVFFVLAVDRDKKQVLALESNASNMVKNTNWYAFDILRFCGTPIKK